MVTEVIHEFKVINRSVGIGAREGIWHPKRENVTKQQEKDIWDSRENVSLWPLWAGGTGGRRSLEQRLLVDINSSQQEDTEEDLKAVQDVSGNTPS